MKQMIALPAVLVNLQNLHMLINRIMEPQLAGQLAGKAQPAQCRGLALWISAHVQFLKGNPACLLAFVLAGFTFHLEVSPLPMPYSYREHIGNKALPPLFTRPEKPFSQPQNRGPPILGLGGRRTYSPDRLIPFFAIRIHLN